MSTQQEEQEEVLFLAARAKKMENGKMSLLDVDSPFGFCGRKRNKNRT